MIDEGLARELAGIEQRGEKVFPDIVRVPICKKALKRLHWHSGKYYPILGGGCNQGWRPSTDLTVWLQAAHAAGFLLTIRNTRDPFEIPRWGVEEDKSSAIFWASDPLEALLVALKNRMAQ